MMRQFRTFPLRLRTLLRKRSVEDDLREEMSFHLEQRVEELAASGVSHERAMQIAIRELGMEREMEKCRDHRAWQGWERLKADLAFGWRQLRKRKITTTAAVLSLALGIGSCMASFRLIDSLFLRPLPITHPERLYLVQYEGPDENGKPFRDDGSMYAELEAMRAAVQGQARVLGVTYVGQFDLGFDGGETERAAPQYVSGEMFPAFGLRPTIGRLFTADDDRAFGQSPYVVLSYDFWTRRFGRDPNVLGHSVHLDKTVFQIVGVAPKGFLGTQPGSATDIFIPITMSPLVKQKDATWFRTLVLTDPGISPEMIRGKLQAGDQIGRRETWGVFLNQFHDLPKQMADIFMNQTVTLTPAPQGASRLREDYGSSLLTLGVLAALVLLIACVNVANLMAGLAATRSREMAVRVSLGAGRGRLVRLMMVESALVGLTSAGVGTLFALWAAPFVVSHIGSPTSPVRLALDPDLRVVAFGAALTVVVMLLFGLAPALRSSHVQPASALKGGADQPTRLRGMYGMVTVQVAFCIAVLFASGLFVRSFAGLAHKPLGFSPEHIVVASIGPQRPESPAQWNLRMEQLRAIPGVERVSMATAGLLSGSWATSVIDIPGTANIHVPMYGLLISPGWLETMQIHLLAGRDLTPSDQTHNVALVNEAFARKYFDGKNPVGRYFVNATHSGTNPAKIEVVGLVADAAYTDLHKAYPPTAYSLLVTTGSEGLPVQQPGAFILRTKGNPALTLSPIRQALRRMPGLELRDVTLQTELIGGQLIRERMLAALAGFFATVALLLASIGLYGVLHYSVVQREKEIGIRIALGAAAANIVRIVTARLLTMVCLGAIAGLTIGQASMRFITALLYGVRGTDLSMITAPFVLMIAVVAVAALPAVLRALHIDPARMLRAE